MSLPVAFCSNLLPAETLADIRQQLSPFAESIREGLGWKRLGIDLRVSQEMIQRLAAAPDQASNWALELDRLGLQITSINAFPLLPFQNERVKENAYRPPWPDAQREHATTALLTIVEGLCPDQDVVTISTVPGTYRGWPSETDPRPSIAAAWGRFAAAAAVHHDNGGKLIILCPEPEPWCTLESADDTATFWREYLLTDGVAAAAQALDGDEVAALHALRNHIHLCLDTCHVAVAGDSMATTVPQLLAVGAIPSKCQVSNCPAVQRPGLDPDGLKALLAMAEPRFCHQSILLYDDGRQRRFADIDLVPATVASSSDVEEMRSHFHIPLNSEKFTTPTGQTIGTTQNDAIVGIKQAQLAKCQCFSVETYTWSIIASNTEQRIQGTVAELAWLADHL